MAECTRAGDVLMSFRGVLAVVVLLIGSLAVTVIAAVVYGVSGFTAAMPFFLLAAAIHFLGQVGLGQVGQLTARLRLARESSARLDALDPS